MAKNNIPTLTRLIHRAAIYLLALVLLCPAARSQDISRDTYNGEAEITTPHGSISLLPGFIVPYGSSTKIYIGGAGVSLTISALADQAVTVGQQVTISATASGGVLPYGYGLYRNGALVSNTSTYTFTASLADNNSTYYVRCTDALNNSVQSNTATVTVTSTPIPLTISTPTNQSVRAGSYANFSVSASGGVDPKTVVWKRNGSNVGTGLSYTYGPAVLADNAQTVSATVTDAANNTATSGIAVLTVTDTTGTTSGTTFSYILTQASRVSIGIYSTDSNRLIRTAMFADTFMPAGTHTFTWDGRDDNRNLAPDGNYKVQVTTNGITSTPVYGVGNTSDSLSGPTVWTHPPASGMVQVDDNNAVVILQGAEAAFMAYRFDLRHPQQKQSILFKATYTTEYAIASDNSNVYMVIATPSSYGFTWGVVRMSNKVDSMGTFLNLPNTYAVGNNQGTFYFADTANSPAGTTNTAVNAKIAVAVQKSGNYYFAGGLQTLDVLDKSTNTIVYTTPTPINKLTCYGDLLYATCTDGFLRKYSVNNSTGALTLLQQINLGNPQALDVSITGDTLSVCRLDHNNIIRLHTNDLSQIDILGQDNGYSQSPIVSNDKFYWNDLRNGFPTFITSLRDGGFWVGDYGNTRILHYSPGFAYQEQIMWQPQVYFGCIDWNDPNHLFIWDIEDILLTIQIQNMLVGYWIEIMAHIGFQVYWGIFMTSNNLQGT